MPDHDALDQIQKLADDLDEARRVIAGLLVQYCMDGDVPDLIREDAVSAQEEAIRLLKAAGLVEYRQPPPKPIGWFSRTPIYSDPFPAGHYLVDAG